MISNERRKGLGCEQAAVAAADDTEGALAALAALTVVGVDENLDDFLLKQAEFLFAIAVTHVNDGVVVGCDGDIGPMLFRDGMGSAAGLSIGSDMLVIHVCFLYLLGRVYHIV